MHLVTVRSLINSPSKLLMRLRGCVQSEGVVGGAPAPPLVGNKAPDFSAQAVFDQEFIDITLSQYRVPPPSPPHPPSPTHTNLHHLDVYEDAVHVL